jgi:hypothetical protein
MRVWTQDDSKLWRLGPGLTNGDWIEIISGGIGDTTINATVDTSINSPTTIHTYNVVATGRAVIAYDVTVTTIKTFGGSANFRIAATFEVDNGGTITEKDVTFMNGPFRDDPAWDVVFNILPSGIELQVVGINALQRWHAVGYISFVDRLFPESCETVFFAPKGNSR